MQIEESANNYIPKDEEEQVNPENGYPNEGNERKENSILKMLKSETGEGTIQSYNNHPLNMKNDNYVSQMIRGLTGMMGSLNFAILDIILGGFGFAKEKRENVSYEVVKDEDNKNPIQGPSVVNGHRNV